MQVGATGRCKCRQQALWTGASKDRWAQRQMGAMDSGCIIRWCGQAGLWADGCYGQVQAGEHKCRLGTTEYGWDWAGRHCGVQEPHDT